jgi:hypothetical protein
MQYYSLCKHMTKFNEYLFAIFYILNPGNSVINRKSITGEVGFDQSGGEKYHNLIKLMLLKIRDSREKISNTNYIFNVFLGLPS